MKECKKRIREMLRDYGYKKITLAEHKHGVTKCYYLYDGEIHIHFSDELFFSFGLDKLMGCSAHICAGGTDCGMHFLYAEEFFKKLLTGEMTEKEIIRQIAA